MITAYTVRKNGEVIKKGFSPTFYIHGIMASTMEKYDADEIEIVFPDDKIITIKSPRIMFKERPASVSVEEHTRWFTGCRYPLEDL